MHESPISGAGGVPTEVDVHTDLVTGINQNSNLRRWYHSYHIIVQPLLLDYL